MVTKAKPRFETPFQPARVARVSVMLPITMQCNPFPDGGNGIRGHPCVAGSRVPFHSLGMFFLSAMGLRHHVERQNLFVFGESASAIIKALFPHLLGGNILSKTPFLPASQFLLLVAQIPGCQTSQVQMEWSTQQQGHKCPRGLGPFLPFVAAFSRAAH